MNNKRRTEIRAISKELDSLKSRLEKILMDEEFSFDNMPENLQYSMRGEESQEAIENMTSSVDSLEEAINNLSSAIV